MEVLVSMVKSTGADADDIVRRKANSVTML